MKRIIILSLVVMGMLLMVSCSSDDDSGTNANVDVDAWVGTWLSAGSDVAPLLVALFNYDSVRVELTDQNTVKTSSHVTDGAWNTVEGTYVVTESTSGDVHSVRFVYSAFEQEGIFQVIDATPDSLKLEVVQTNPDIGATPRTVETGFGSDASLGTINIQRYVKE